MLTDGEIRAEIEASRIRIEPPPHDRCIQPVSVDLTMGDTWRQYRGTPASVR